MVGAAAVTGAGGGEVELLTQALDLRVLIAAELADDKAGRWGAGFSKRKVAKGRSGS